MSDEDEMWQPGTPVDYAHAIEMLEDMEAQLPRLDCIGKCWDSCTAIDASELERRRLAEHGITLPDAPATKRLRLYEVTRMVPRCPALTSFNTCSVYTVRPFVCRAFGMVLDRRVPTERIYQPMMCDHGCVGDKPIDLPRFAALLDQIEYLSRAVTGVTRRRTLAEHDQPSPDEKMAATPRRCPECRRRNGHKMDCTMGRTKE